MADIAPGNAFVNRRGIIALAIYLLLLLLLLFFLIGWLWPTCEDTNCPVSATQNQNRAANSNNSNGAAPGPAANTDSNANTNTNTNTSTDTTTNTTTNTNETAPPGPTRTPATSAPNPARSPTTPAPGSGQTTGIDVDTITPISGSVCGGAQVTIKGKNFPATEPVVKFGGVPAFVNSHSSDTISANSPAHPAGTVDVVVEGNGQTDKIPLAFSYTCPSPSGGTLFWLVVLAGALGGTIHALRSFYWYVGNRELKLSWVLMYVFLPFTGAAIALIFYLIIVAGLLPSSTGKDVPLYVIAVGALAGMFSTQAALKLTDLGNAIFVKPGEGKDAKPQPAVPPGGPASVEKKAKIDRATGPVGGGQTVKITNTGFKDVKSVMFGGNAATNVTLDVGADTITATTPEAAQTGTVDVVVMNAAGESVKMKYEYTAAAGG